MRSVSPGEWRDPDTVFARNTALDQPPPNLEAKVYYRPVEAAIRWAGLMRSEKKILKTVGTSAFPERADFPRWPGLCFYAERIRDALVNGELKYGKNGVTCDDPAILNDPELTIRHVDLRKWVADTYPDRPAFLFDGIERQLSRDSAHILMMDREALKIQLTEQLKAYETLQADFQALSAAYNAREAEDKKSKDVGERSESTYLNIIGGLLTLLLGKAPDGKPYSSFRSQDAIIDAVMGHYRGRDGISISTLCHKFAEANRHLASSGD
jgi:hypothetical protein